MAKKTYRPSNAAIKIVSRLIAPPSPLLFAQTLLHALRKCLLLGQRKTTENKIHAPRHLVIGRLRIERCIGQDHSLRQLILRRDPIQLPCIFGQALRLTSLSIGVGGMAPGLPLGCPKLTLRLH